MSTPTHRKKRAKTTGTNNATTNDTVGTKKAKTYNTRSHSVTTQMNDMKNEFEMKLSQLTNTQRDQQYQFEVLRSENTKLVKNNKELRHELNQVKEKMDSKMNEMKNEFKKHLENIKKASTGGSRSRSSFVAFEDDELSNDERSTVTQEVELRLPTTINNVKNIKKTKELSLHHDDRIYNVLIFTSKNNEKMLVTAGFDGSIKINRLGDNNLVETIENAHSDYVYSLAMTKINNTDDVIASGGSDKMVKLWSIGNFKEVASFECNSSVGSLSAYELNGKYMLACGLYFGSIELWDVQSKKKVDTLNHGDDSRVIRGRKLHSSGVWELHTFKYQNKTYLLSGDINKLNLWNLDNENKLVKTLFCDKGGVGSLATFEFNNDLFISAGLKRKVKLWKMSNLELYDQFDLQGDYSIIRGLKPFMSNGKVMLATVNYLGWFHVLDIEGGKVVHEFKCENHEFCNLCVCEEDGNYVFIAGGENIETKKGSVVFLK